MSCSKREITSTVLKLGNRSNGGIKWFSHEKGNGWKFSIYIDHPVLSCCFCRMKSPLLNFDESGYLCIDCIRTLFRELNENVKFNEAILQKMKKRRKELKLKVQEMKKFEQKLKKKIYIMKDEENHATFDSTTIATIATPTATATATIATATATATTTTVSTAPIILNLCLNLSHKYPCIQIKNLQKSCIRFKGSCLKCDQKQILTLSVFGQEKFFSFCQACIIELFQESEILVKNTKKMEKKQTIEEVRQKIAELEKQIQTMKEEEAKEKTE
jgi:hypothetical protein